MSYLADVNVWIALAVDDHIHHAAAAGWVENSGNAPIIFCRTTQQGFLRPAHQSARDGQDALTAVGAWHVYDRVCQSSRVKFAEEPPGLEQGWRDTTRRLRKGPNFWTDAYLTAFAIASGLTVLTFDRQLALARLGGSHAQLLQNEA
jgi:toxin-antitoxin system PIN domain toxin